MNKIINKNYYQVLAVKIGLLMFFLLLPLKNTYAILPEHLPCYGMFSFMDIYVLILTFCFIVILIFLRKKVKKCLALSFLYLFLLFIFGGSDIFSKVSKWTGCSLKNGNIIGRTCYIKSSDYKKPCKSHSECEGFCVIENREDFTDKYKWHFGDSASDTVSIEEFEKKTKSKILLRCSKYKDIKNICVPKLEENGVIYLSKGWGGGVPGCFAE